jgi:hypothetical protein
MVSTSPRPQRRQRARLPLVHALLVAGPFFVVACTSPVTPPANGGTGAGPGVTAAAPVEAATPRELPPRTGLSLQDRASWLAVLNWPDECESAFQASHVGNDPGLVFHPLTSQLSVVEVVCAAGSYQASSTVIRLDERTPTREVSVLRFPIYESEDGVEFTTTETSEIWGEIAIAAAKPVMTVLNLARQTGDCGVWTRYDIASTVPAIIDVRARLPCPSRARPPVRFAVDHGPPGWRAPRTTR